MIKREVIPMTELDRFYNDLKEMMESEIRRGKRSIEECFLLRMYDCANEEKIELKNTTSWLHSLNLLYYKYKEKERENG